MDAHTKLPPIYIDIYEETLKKLNEAKLLCIFYFIIIFRLIIILNLNFNKIAFFSNFLKL